MKTTLLQGENLLYHGERVDSAIYKSLPMMQGAGAMPSLHSIELLVTDRRVSVRGAIFEMWYPGQGNSYESDVLERVSTDKSRFGGEHLHLTVRGHGLFWLPGALYSFEPKVGGALATLVTN